MQKIFNQELRFKDDNGNDYPDWERKPLGKIGNIVSGLTYSPDDIDENGILVLRSSNVQNRILTFKDNVFVKVEEGKFNPVWENDILICVRNGSKNLIGKNAIINKESEGMAFGAFMTVYRSDFNTFLFHFFDTEYYNKEIHKNLGATINSINGSNLKKFKVPFPCKDEQTKIANFLSAIDAKINHVSNQLEQTNTFKKGLLQQMFV
ncbi:restriction endonuclease subunit S [Thalassobellus suaedae]|uniref:Restriction endonuclease subunit S n=1 Tax=Thalassobellus suaedae TaxID=3074124 RepID=A0ABY9XXA5_9FLAO|nr:restriction endonuclease subunit S [Flavobacteriaceae bacterium HL-DH14]